MYDGQQEPVFVFLCQKNGYQTTSRTTHRIAHLVPPRLVVRIDFSERQCLAMQSAGCVAVWSSHLMFLKITQQLRTPQLAGPPSFALISKADTVLKRYRVAHVPVVLRMH